MAGTPEYLLKTAFFRSEPPSTPLRLHPILAVLSRGRPSPDFKPRCTASFFGWGYSHVPPVALCFVEPCDGLLGSLIPRELHERKASWPTRHPVGRQKYLYDVTDLREHVLQLASGGVVTQIANEYS